MMDSLEADFGLPLESQAQTLWSQLAAVARLPADVGGKELGRALDSSASVVIAQSLPPLLEVMRMTEAAAEAYGSKVAALLPALPTQALTRALERLDIPDRRRTLQTAAKVLPPPALIPLIVAAAPAYEQQLGVPFTELLRKLAAGAGVPAGPIGDRADETFRLLIHLLNDRWATMLLNTNSAGFGSIVSDAATDVPRTALAPGATRLVQLALETGAVGPMVWVALSTLVESEAGVRGVVEMLKRAEPTLASQVITEQIATPTRLAVLLRENPIDWEAADTLIRQLSVKAAKPLIDQLVVTETRAGRRAIMDRVVQLGPDIHPMVLERVGDERWYVVRNMVVLLRESGSYLEPVLADRLAAHPDPRVRREVLLLRLERETGRERALSDALRDTDKQVLRAALHAAGSNLPGSGALVLARRVSEPNFPAELRVLSLRLLGRSAAPAALEALLRVASGGKTLFGRPQLAAKSPELLAALSGLARSWARDPKASELINLASKSGDPEIVAAIRSASGEGEA